MSKESTERKARSQDRRVLKDLSMADVYDFLQQEDETEGKARARVLLEKQYESAKEGDSRAQQSLLDRGYGKAPQAVDVTSKGESLSAGIFIDWGDDDEEKV